MLIAHILCSSADLYEANPDELERILYEVSSPSHPNYGQHLTWEESRRLVKPSAEGRSAVTNWLKNSGISERDIQHKEEWIHFKATARQADSLMNTKFLVYRHIDENTSDAVRTIKVVLPRDIHPHIKMIHPTTRFGLMKPQRSIIHKIEDLSGMDDTNCASMVTPKCLKTLYKIPSGEMKLDAEKAGTLGVAGFLTQYARYNDLSRFLASSASWAVGSNFTWSSINGKSCFKLI
jgi:tripeptidyl-peptidase-1